MTTATAWKIWQKREHLIAQGQDIQSLIGGEDIARIESTLQSPVRGTLIKSGEDYPTLTPFPMANPIPVKGGETYICKWNRNSEFWDYSTPDGQPIASIPLGYEGECPLSLLEAIVKEASASSQGTLPKWVASLIWNTTPIFVEDGERYKFEASWDAGVVLVTHAYGEDVPFGDNPNDAYRYSPWEFALRYYPVKSDEYGRDYPYASIIE